MEEYHELEKAYEKMIWKIIYSLRIYKNHDEFFQIGRIALWEAYKNFDEKKASFTTYAYSVIRGKILTELNNERMLEKKRALPEEGFWELIEDLNQQLPLEKEMILSLCSRLTEKQQKWVLYTAFGDLSVKEIAEAENVSISAVKAWRKGARKKLLDTLDLRR